MKPPLFSVWEEPFPLKQSLPFRAQLVNYIGCFATELAAYSFVNGVKLERERINQTEMVVQNRKG